jgi:hypothetical protein
MKMLGNIIGRFKEPSSYSAIGGMLALFGLNIGEEVMQQIVQVGAGISFFISYFMKEGS